MDCRCASDLADGGLCVVLDALGYRTPPKTQLRLPFLRIHPHGLMHATALLERECWLVVAEEAADDASDFQVFGGNDDVFHCGVGGLEADGSAVAVELFERDVLAAD